MSEAAEKREKAELARLQRLGKKKATAESRAQYRAATKRWHNAKMQRVAVKRVKKHGPS